jgi:hypothetical protein
MTLWLGLSHDLSPVVVGPASFITTRTATHINSNNHSEICLLFVWSPRRTASIFNSANVEGTGGKKSLRSARGYVSPYSF